MIKIFLSYAHADLSSAQRLYRVLDSTPAVDVWLDKESLLPGQEWEVEIRRAIERSDFFILLLSKKSTTTKGFYQSEIRRALRVLDDYPEGEVYLIPVRLDDCDLHFERLASIQYVDLFPDWNAGVEKITRAMRLHSRKPHASTVSSSAVRFTSHQAQFDPYPGCFYYILNVSNASPDPVEITHLWYEDISQSIVIQRASRPLPRRLDASESWASWIAVDDLPETTRGNAYDRFRVRLSNGDVVESSKEDTIPPRGKLPGGSILQSDRDVMAKYSNEKVDSEKASLRRVEVSPSKSEAAR